MNNNLEMIDNRFIRRKNRETAKNRVKGKRIGKVTDSNISSILSIGSISIVFIPSPPRRKTTRNLFVRDKSRGPTYSVQRTSGIPWWQLGRGGGEPPFSKDGGTAAS